MISKAIRGVVLPLKEAVGAAVAGAKLLVRQLSSSPVDVGSELGTSEEKSAEEIAMDEYRWKLEHTFGSSERIDNIMEVVRDWSNGE